MAVTGSPYPRWAGYLSEPVRPEARLVLFCLPPAGGGAAAFRPWTTALSPDVEVQPIRLPGRESRLTEPPEVDLTSLVDAVADRIDRPYAVLGHSFGALLGFEMLRSLRRRGAPEPVRFYPAASRPPHLREPLAGLGRLDDDAFIAKVADLGGTPDGVFDDPDLRALVLPALRADFGFLDAYVHLPERPLDTPIVALAGTEDRTLPPAVMVDWARHTTAGFQVHRIPGGHFFVQHAVDEVAPLIAADLRDALAA